jgi:hypothetical protein
MHDPAGIVRNVGYHQVLKKLDDGFRFVDKPTLQQYARDHAADPLDESRVDQWIDKHPVLSWPVKGVIGAGTEALKTLTAFDATPQTRLGTDVQLAAATPPKGIQEAGAGAFENAMELYNPEGLGNLLGRAGQAMTAVEKLKMMTGLGQIIEKVPMVGKLLKIGESAAKMGTMSAGQTFVKTGGDTRAAATAGAVGAVTAPLAEIPGAVWSAGRTMLNAPKEAAAEQAAAAAARQTTAAENVAATQRQAEASRQAYAETARGAIRPHLEETNAARNVPQQEVMMNQPGGKPAVPTGRMAATATGKPAPPQIDIDSVLKQTQDFTGAADHLTAINDDAYNQFDTATGGRFRQLNGEVAAAQNAMRKGEQGAAQLYKQKLGEMDQLIDSTGRELTPEMKAAGERPTGGEITKQMKAAAKSGFRQSYMLRDFGNLWDRNLNGVPGASQASQAQRGINGRGLLTDLQRAVKLYGRPDVETALGPGRLENLEDIAQQNVTEKQRAAFNGGVQNVAQELARLDREAAKAGTTQPERLSQWGKRALVMTAGAGVSHAVGGSPYLGAITAEGMYESSRFVLNAIKTNPKIAKNFLFALQSGATAERFGPFIATMIQKAMTDSSLKQQQQEQQERQQQ